MAAKKTPAEVYARMIKIGFTCFDTTRDGKVVFHREAASDEEKSIRRWCGQNGPAFCAYILTVIS